jgi:hypothetical protein
MSSLMHLNFDHEQARGSVIQAEQNIAEVEPSKILLM